MTPDQMTDEQINAAVTQEPKWNGRESVVHKRDASGRILPSDLTPTQRFVQKVDVKGEDDCWKWLGATRAYGYGEFRFDGESYPAHRWLFQKFHSKEIPKHIEVCHRCDNPGCVNPKHMFLGTHTDNMRDMARKKRGKAGRTHCEYGHEYTEENTYWRPHSSTVRRSRVCRTCARERHKRWRKRHADH